MKPQDKHVFTQTP